MSKKIPKVHQYSTTDFPMGKKWKKNKLKFSLHKKNCSATTHYFQRLQILKYYKFNNTLVCHGVGVQTLKNIYKATNHQSEGNLLQIDRSFQQTYLSNQKPNTIQIAKLWQFKNYLDKKIDQTIGINEKQYYRYALMYNWIVSGPFHYLHLIDLQLKQWIKQFRQEDLLNLNDIEAYKKLTSECIQQKQLQTLLTTMSLHELYSVLQLTKKQWFLKFWKKNQTIKQLNSMINRKKDIFFQMKLYLEDEICQKYCFQLIHFKIRPQENWTNALLVEAYKKIQKNPYLTGKLSLDSYKTFFKHSKKLQIKQKVKQELQENFQLLIERYDLKYSKNNPTQKIKIQQCTVFRQQIIGVYKQNQQQYSYLSEKFNQMMRKKLLEEEIVQQVRLLKGTIDTHIFIRYRNHIVKTLIELNTKRK